MSLLPPLVSPDELRRLILKHPDLPASELAAMYQLRPIQVAGYRAAETIRQRQQAASRSMPRPARRRTARHSTLSLRTPKCLVKQLAHMRKRVTVYMKQDIARLNQKRLRLQRFLEKLDRHLRSR